MMYEYIQQNVCIPEATGATTCHYKNMNEVHFFSNPLLLWTLALPFHFLEQFVQNWYYFFLKCLIELTSSGVFFVVRFLTKNSI